MTDGNTIYEAYLKIGKAYDGRNILYAVNCNVKDGIAADKGATQKRAAVLEATPSGDKVSQISTPVNKGSAEETRSAPRVTAEEDARYLELAKDPVTYDDAGNVIPLSERFNPEKEDIRYSTRLAEQLDADSVDRSALDIFGTTADPKDAGYIMRSGALLDFGKQKSSFFGGTAMWHDRIIRAMEGVEDSIDTRDAATQAYIAMGNIRVNFNGNENRPSVINAPNNTQVSNLTDEQYAALRNALRETYSKLTLAFAADESGKQEYRMYTADTPSRVILDDIREYYRTGALPAESTARMFRYSTRAADSLERTFSKPITVQDVMEVRSIGRKSVSRFTSDDIARTQKWAYKYFHQLGIKSPFFRNWFGDWRSADQSKVTVTEIPQIDIRTQEFKTAIKNQRTIEGIDIEDTKNASDGYGWKVAISAEGERNTRSHSGSGKHSYEALAAIRNLVRNAVLLDTEVHEHHSNNSQSAETDHIAFDHKLYSLGRSENGAISLYKITVEESYHDRKNTNSMRFHNLKYIEKVAENIGGRTAYQSMHGVSTSDVSATMYTVADLYKFVKQYDKDFNFGFEPNRALLDHDGHPIIFYHGSPDSFDEFDPGRSGKRLHLNRIGIGNYFTTSRAQAERYAENGGPVYGMYLNIRNPFTLTASRPGAAEIIASELGIRLADPARNAEGYIVSQNGNLTDELKKRGYDGVILYKPGSGGVIDEINAFDANQIKSATENIEAMYRGQLEALEEEARSGNDAKAQSGEIKIPCGTGSTATHGNKNRDV